MTVLIVDDEQNILELLKFNLEREGYDSLLAKDGYEALEKIKSKRIDLIILDIMLPKMNGYQLCKKLKKEKKYKRIPIIFLSAKNEIEDVTKGLSLGATDYLSKPFSPRELLSRIKAILRRSKEDKNTSFLQLGDIKIDIKKHQVIFKGEEVDLTYKEFFILKLLLKNKETVYSREKLLEEVWDSDNLTTFRTIDVHIRNLRRKLDEYNVKNPQVETIRGIGYKLSAF